MCLFRSLHNSRELWVVCLCLCGQVCLFWRISTDFSAEHTFQFTSKLKKKKKIINRHETKLMWAPSPIHPSHRGYWSLSQQSLDLLPAPLTLTSARGNSVSNQPIIKALDCEGKLEYLEKTHPGTRGTYTERFNLEPNKQFIVCFILK